MFKRTRTDRSSETPEQRLERLREYQRTLMRARRGHTGALDAPPRPYVRKELTAEELAAPPGVRRRRRGARTPTEQWLAKLRKLSKAVDVCDEIVTRYSNFNGRERIEHRKALEQYESDRARLNSPDARDSLRRPTMLPPMEETPEQVATREAVTKDYLAHVALHPDLAQEYESRITLQIHQRAYHRATTNLNRYLTRRITRINDAYRDPITGLDPLATPLPPGHPDAPAPAPAPAPQATPGDDDAPLPPGDDDDAPGDDYALPAGVTPPRTRQPPTATLARLSDQHDRLLGLRRRLTSEHAEQIERPSLSLPVRNRLQLRLNDVKRREEELYAKLERARWRVDDFNKTAHTTHTELQTLQWEVKIAKTNLDRFNRENPLPDPPRAPLFPSRDAAGLDTALGARQRARDYESEAHPVSRELRDWALYVYDVGYSESKAFPYLTRRRKQRRVKATTVLIDNRINGKQTRVLTHELLAALLQLRSPPRVHSRAPAHDANNT